tara:strand:+ start:3890 stop:4270 length:381 start_codon:yes stop_codon:yes gene_type:complete
MYKQSLENFSDNRGDLRPLDFDRLPFLPKRLFIVSNVPKGETRGCHAHFKTRQFLICLKGEVEAILDDGKTKSSITLTPAEGVYVPELVWDSQIFKTDNDILLVLASTHYNKSDYIDCYSTFINSL